MEKIPFETGGNKKAQDELKTLDGHHLENLYDQNEDASGERVNLATGQAFNNSAPEGSAFDALAVVEPSDTGDVLPPIPEEEDAAARWLRENDLLNNV